MPIPKPEPLLDQILWAIQWIGLAAFIAIAAVGALRLINRIRSKKTPKHVT
jgi:cytochrome oxidase assembly protein ShyY1